MTSGHANVTYGSAHSSHSNGMGHSNTSGSVGHGNSIAHTLTWEAKGDVTFPLDTCEGSLAKLYEKSEQIRNQYNSASKKNTSSLLPTKPYTITLGSINSSSSLLYKLLDNARNQGEPQYLSSTFRVSGKYKTGNDYVSQSTHTSSAHSSHTNTYIYGDASKSGSGTANIAGSASVTYIQRINAWNTSSILNSGSSIIGTAGQSALKTTLDALWTLLCKNHVWTSVAGAGDINVGTINNCVTGHSNHSSHSNDYSKREYKTNIKDFNRSAIDDINKINIVEFNYKPEYGDPTINRVGFIADDTDEIFSTRYHDRMDYMNCIGMLLKSVQELSSKVNKLEAELKEKNK